MTRTSIIVEGHPVKTLTHLAGSITLPDATADSVLTYSLALARRHATDTVTLVTSESSITFIVGHGIALCLHEPNVPAAELAGDTPETLAGKIAALEPTPVQPDDTDTGFDMLRLWYPEPSHH